MTSRIRASLVVSDHLLPPLADTVGNYYPLLYLDLPYDQVSESIRTATFHLLLDEKTERDPFCADPCWVRTCPEERINQFLRPLPLNQLETVLISAATMNLPNLVKSAIREMRNQRDVNLNTIKKAWAYALEYHHRDCLDEFESQAFPLADQDLLEVAAWEGFLRAVQIQSSKTNDWDIALRYAAHKGHLSVVQWLIEKCPPDKREAYIKTAIIESTVTQQIPVLEWLFSQPADMEKELLTLEVAVKRGRPQVVKWLFSRGLSLGAEDVQDNIWGFFKDSSTFNLQDTDFTQTLRTLLSLLPPQRAEETVLQSWEIATHNDSLWMKEHYDRAEIRWLLYQKGVITPDRLTATLERAVKEDHTHTFKWILHCERADELPVEAVIRILQTLNCPNRIELLLEAQSRL